MNASSYYRFRSVVSIIIAMVCAAASANDEPKSAAPARTIRDITSLLDQYRPDSTKISSIQNVMNEPQPNTQDSKDLARHYKKKAVAASEIGATREYLSYMRKVVELGGDWDIGEDQAQLAGAEVMNGNIAEATRALQTALETLPKLGYNTKKSYAAGRLAHLLGQMGDLASAEKYLELSEQFHSAFKRQSNAYRYKSSGDQHSDLNRVAILTLKGKYGESEALLRHALSLMPDVRQENETARRVMDGATRHTEGQMDWRELGIQGNLAKIVAYQGRLTEAEFISRSALITAIRKFGKYSYYTGNLSGDYVEVLLLQGRYVEAEQLARATLEIYRNVGTPEDTHSIYHVRSNLGIALVAQRRYSDALEEFDGMRQAFRGMPSLQSRLVRGNSYWALALIETGDSATALPMLDVLISNNSKWMGSEHPETLALVALRALALFHNRQPDAALKEFRSVQNGLIEEILGHGDEASPLKAQVMVLALEGYLRVLSHAYESSAEQAVRNNAANEAFRIADVLRGQNTQQAVVASAARAAANDPAIGKEIRKQQDLHQESAALFRILRDLMNAPPEQQLPKVMADMHKRIDAIRGELNLLEANITRRFPAYANLVRPLPPSLSEARAVLRPGEALLNIFSSADRTYVWAMRNEGRVAFDVVTLTRDQIAGMVRKLRTALDPGDVNVEVAIPRFDLDTGYELYARLLVPVQDGWKGATSILVATNGALGQLPLSVLPTAKANLPIRQGLPYSEYTSVPWLVRDMAVTQLPSINALVVLRKLPTGSSERSPFIGFGDPLFAQNHLGVPNSKRGLVGNRKLRNLSVTRTEVINPEGALSVSGNQVTGIGSAAGTASVLTVIPGWVEYSKIPPLPDTREEILSLASALRADTEKDVYLGADASKANVKKTDLSKRRIVAFATHGLLPNDFPGVNEPSLALANPNDGTHGLLTLEEILGLKLDADWVVLSACNTAAGDGGGSDAISGLGRGFFYAGTRALLVTHWPVESVSARLLVTGIFDRQAADSKLSRAEALRQSMLALMQQRESDFTYGHPLFWAPYALVGDGGAGEVLMAKK